MGTRHLTMVIHNRETKVAQYGQWDGYPRGQGIVVLNFLKSCDINVFKDKLQFCQFIDNNKRKQQEIENFIQSIGSKDGYMTMEQSKLYEKKYPGLSRNTGASIFEIIYNHKTKKSICLNNSEDFAGDSLFCEWAYVIDLDKNVLEVYKGFNKEPLTIEDRFYKFTDPNSDYHPIKLIASYDLNNLPEVHSVVHELEDLVRQEEE